MYLFFFWRRVFNYSLELCSGHFALILLNIYGETYGGGLRYDGVAGDFPLASRPPTTTAGGGTYSSQSLSPKIKLDYFNDFLNNYYYVLTKFGWVCQLKWPPRRTYHSYLMYCRRVVAMVASHSLR